jgi:hypothetical protein
MNRWVVAAVMGLLVVGCAAGVEDPQPTPEPPAPQKQPPTETFSGELADQQDSVGSLGDAVKNVPPKQKPLPVPGF